MDATEQGMVAPLVDAMLLYRVLMFDGKVHSLRVSSARIEPLESWEFRFNVVTGGENRVVSLVHRDLYVLGMHALRSLSGIQDEADA